MPEGIKKAVWRSAPEGKAFSVLEAGPSGAVGHLMRLNAALLAKSVPAYHFETATVSPLA